jgi:hypothetical protein
MFLKSLLSGDLFLFFIDSFLGKTGIEWPDEPEKGL